MWRRFDPANITANITSPNLSTAVNTTSLFVNTLQQVSLIYAFLSLICCSNASWVTELAVECIHFIVAEVVFSDDDILFSYHVPFPDHQGF